MGYRFDYFSGGVLLCKTVFALKNIYLYVQFVVWAKKKLTKCVPYFFCWKKMWSPWGTICYNAIKRLRRRLRVVRLPGAVSRRRSPVTCRSRAPCPVSSRSWPSCVWARSAGPGGATASRGSPWCSGRTARRHRSSRWPAAASRPLPAATPPAVRISPGQRAGSTGNRGEN